MMSPLFKLRMYYSELKFTSSVDFSDLEDYIKKNKGQPIPKRVLTGACSVEDFENEEKDDGHQATGIDISSGNKRRTTNEQMNPLNGSTSTSTTHDNEVLAGGTLVTKKQKSKSIEITDVEKEALNGTYDDDVEMVELYRWKRLSNGGKQFMKIQVPSSIFQDR